MYNSYRKSVILRSFFLFFFIVCYFLFFYFFIKNEFTFNKNKLLNTIILVGGVFIYPYLWYLFLKELKIKGRTLIWVIVILFQVYLSRKCTNEILIRNLQEANIVIPGVVYEKYSNINSPGRIYYEFYGEDGKLYSGKEICPEGSYRSFEIGDTVLVRYAISDPYLNKVYNFWPTSNEIKEYRNGKKYKYVNGQYVEVKGDE